MPGFIIAGPGDHAPIPSLSDGSGRQEFYYKYTWEVTSYFEDDGASDVPLYSDNPLVYLKDATLPTFTANVDSIVGGSLEYKWAKSVIWEDVKLSWYDSVGLVEKMRKWRKRVWNPITGIQPASAYKKMSKLKNYLPTYDGDKLGQPITWVLNNSWPKIIKYGDLTYTQSDVKLIEMTVAYDWAEEETEIEDQNQDQIMPQPIPVPVPTPAPVPFIEEDIEMLGRTGLL